MTERAASPVGTLIADRYEVLGVIARGGQAVVCRGLDRQRSAPVAIKMLASSSASDPHHAERFAREHQVLEALAGTHVARVLDTCRSDDGKLCLVMELLVGHDLEDELEALEQKNERLPLQRMLGILEPVVETLDSAHRAGIWHRDLKPANIFLLDSGGVRLLDFGFARLAAARPLTAIGTVMGSPSYIAPEVWRGVPDALDQRVDVYSLAVIVFRMLAGKVPFHSPSLSEMLELATKAKRPSLCALRPDLPEEIDVWVEHALAVDPNQRFRTARALLQAMVGAIEPAR
jgi:serine/threonine-protein kinase